METKTLISKIKMTRLQQKLIYCKFENTICCEDNGLGSNLIKQMEKSQYQDIKVW